MPRIPANEWAINKVRKYMPPCPEKVTLMQIAGHVNVVTNEAKVSKKTIAWETGKDERTVQRHIQKLEKDGHLVADREDRWEHRASIYRIPMASFSIEELEFMRGVSGEQLSFAALVPEEIGDAEEQKKIWKSLEDRQWESRCLPMGDMVSPDGSQNVSPPMTELGITSQSREMPLGKGLLLTLKKKKKANIQEEEGMPIFQGDTVEIMRGVDPELASQYEVYRERAEREEREEQARMATRLAKNAAMAEQLKRRGVSAIADVVPIVHEQIASENPEQGLAVRVSDTNRVR